MYLRILFFFSLLVIPGSLYASVRITEIAWMGVVGENGQFGEWIELYNDETASVNVAGWKLYGTGDQLVFTLSTEIPAQGYLLIKRTTASMPDPLPGVPGEKGTFGGGGFSNEGEDLVLKDASGQIVQSLLYATGWPAGESSSKQTMQWSGAVWETAPATPGTGFLVKESNDTPSAPPLIEQQKTSSRKKEVTTRYEPRITLYASSELYQYVDHEFIADITLEDGLRHKSGYIVWNMGDGTVITQKMLAPVMHHYDYPGTYVVWLGYYKNSFATAPYLSTVKTIKVGSPSVVISKVNNNAIELTNQSGKMVDLSGWNVISGGVLKPLPQFTMLAPDASIVINAQTLGFDLFLNPSLARPGGQILTQEQVPSTPTVQGVTGYYSSDRKGDIKDLQTEAIFSEKTEKDIPKKQNRTKQYVFGAVALTVLALCILLERVMAKQEYQQEE